MNIMHQLKAFENILKAYDGKLPLHRFLLTYFKQHKQMGSSDRRWALRYLYSFFRLGNALKEEELTTRLAVADFLCNTTPSLVQSAFLQDLTDKVEVTLQEKLAIIQEKFPSFNLDDVFPFGDQLSPDIEVKDFEASFFVQPDLFIRSDTNTIDQISSLLEDQSVLAEQIGPHTLVLPNATKLDQLLPSQLNYRVQDLSSQATVRLFKPAKYDKWWDCCAASGGKTLLLHEAEPTVNLLVSDVRESILENLDIRLRAAGINKYQKKVIDLLQNNDQILHHYEFDGILLDAPCTGSGTWGRTPEQLTFFDAHRIPFFSKLQRTIAANVVKYLKPGKPLIYITCSVFKAENEDTVAYLLENLPLKLEEMEVIKGYGNKADTMFAARMVKV